MCSWKHPKHDNQMARSCGRFVSPAEIRTVPKGSLMSDIELETIQSQVVRFQSGAFLFCSLFKLNSLLFKVKLYEKVHYCIHTVIVFKVKLYVLAMPFPHLQPGAPRRNYFQEFDQWRRKKKKEDAPIMVLPVFGFRSHSHGSLC